MEHRCSVRKPLEFQLLLYKHGLPIQSGVCRNLGLGGMFIETSSRDWRKHESLEVEILGRESVRMRLRAMVVHHGKNGVGVMFDAVSNDQRQLLRSWLFDTNFPQPVPTRPRAVA